jgi:hypothetical protein
MKKIFTSVIIILFSCLVALAQKRDDDYKDGYALKGRDTIWCKIFFNSNHDHATKVVKLMINEEEATFYAGGTITGFSVKDDGKEYNFGTVDVEVSVADRRMANLYFVKKLAAGAIDLYEYTYSIRTNKRTTVNGVEKPGSSSTITQNYTNHYIAKIDSGTQVLSNPVLLPSFRKKDIEPYISDNDVLMASAEKRFSLKELVALINEYNKWASGKMKLQ